MPDTNTVAIGAMYNDGNGIDAGHVRIYTWNGTSWVQLGTDIDGGTANDFFGSSVSMPDVNTVAIGSPQDYLNNYAGYARICTWNGTSWVQKGSDIYGTSPGDNSGWSISMPDPNTVAIGARYNDGNGSASGQVRIYSWNGSVWLQKGFDIYGEAAGDRAGWFVYMPDANTVAIGAPNNDGNGTDAGQVRIYSWSGNAWVQQGLDIDGEVANDFSGMSLSMPDANTIAIGAPRNDGTGSNAGHVRVYSGIVGIEQNDFGNSLAIYPNPTHGNLSLDLENTYTNVVVIVRNELGQEVYNYTFGTTSKLEFTIPGEAGIYFVELNADNKRAMLKAIKK